MEETSFYSTNNHHNERELTIVNVSMLIGKSPLKEKRIRVKVRMLLSGDINMGSPEWLDRAFDYVAKNHDVVSPKVEFNGYDLHFSADNLFKSEGFKSPGCQMRSFEISGWGNSESPDVAVWFNIFIPFSIDAWQWLGAFGGEDCWCSFTPGVQDSTTVCSDERLPLTSNKENEDDSGIDEDEADEIDDEEELDPDNETEQCDTDDVMLEDAKHVIQQEGKVSARSIQRVLSINYLKAAHIIEKLEEVGFLTKGDEYGHRKMVNQNEPSKSGPEELAAYHEEVLDAEPVKRGRGRPRKTLVDPLTIDEETEF